MDKEFQFLRYAYGTFEKYMEPRRDEECYEDPVGHPKVDAIRISENNGISQGKRIQEKMMKEEFANTTKQMIMLYLETNNKTL